MKSFQTLFCERHQCPESEYLKRVFWRCLYPHAIPFVFLLGGIRSRYFATDCRLISGAGRASTVAKVREEISDFIVAPDNGRLLRRTFRIRVSATRLKQLAKRHFHYAESRSPLGDTARG